MDNNGKALLRVESLVKHFPVTAGVMGKTVAEVQAVSGVSFDMARGETLGLVGESGCGKTTVGRCILRLLDPTGGRIEFEGRDITDLSWRAMRPMRRDMQIIFQDPYSSLNPRMTVRDAIGEPLQVHRVARSRELSARVAELMERVGLPAPWMNRYPHEFSGGQRQRIGIARAIALNPKFIVCDEAVSALDVSVRAQVLNLLIKLREEMDLSYLFIAHDLSVVKHISHRIAVMYLGHIMEIAPTEALFENPAHPYTLALLSAIPVPDPTHRSQRIRLPGDVPTPLNPPAACRFHTRCPAVFDRCSAEEPPAFDLGGGHYSKCWLNEDLPGAPDWHARFMRRYELNVQRNRAEGNSVAAEEDIGETGEGSAPESLPPRRHQLRSERGLRRPLGVALMLAGLALALLADAVAGTALLAIAFGLFVLPGARHKAVLIPVFAAILALAVFGGLALRDQRNVQLARVQEQALRAQIEQYRQATGELPENLNELNWRLIETFPGGKAIDPWGQPWTYERDQEGEGYILATNSGERATDN